MHGEQLRATREEIRHEEAKVELESWGRWVTGRLSGSTGASPLANLMGPRATASDRAPVIEAQATLTDDVIAALGVEVYRIAVDLWGRGYSRTFTARQHKVAPQTIARREAEVIDAVARRGLPRNC